MAQERCMFLLITVLCSVSSVKVFPKDGAAVTLACGFNIKPSPAEPLVSTTTTTSVAYTAIKHTILPPQIAATFELETKLPSQAKYTLFPVFSTIEPTPKLTAIKLEPSSGVTADTVDFIAPSSVVKISTLETFDVPANDLLPPKKE
ncbi:uncharacterized protein LOC120634430 [Pararge aegeria]|uniref:Jg7411 protein n=1 Tax=Pararge aegeria aegeria TaxID=348720 RepID=A0A8S4RT85_9NEOP|nr:uncharacterized protein LOC120634430 [Pararge aegeria]CAH2240068.1 jg7411 [Pararge aegeria aegeria]